MTNNVRFAFSVGGTTWAVTNKYWGRQLEFCDTEYNTPFSILVLGFQPSMPQNFPSSPDTSCVWNANPRFEISTGSWSLPCNKGDTPTTGPGPGHVAGSRWPRPAPSEARVDDLLKPPHQTMPPAPCAGGVHTRPLYIYKGGGCRWGPRLHLQLFNEERI